MDVSALNMSNSQLIIAGLLLVLLIVTIPFIIKGLRAKPEWDKLSKAAEKGGVVEQEKYKMAWVVLAVEKNKLFRSSYIVLLMFSVANILTSHGLPLESSHSIIKDKVYMGVSIFLVAALFIPIAFIISNYRDSKKELANLEAIKTKLGVTGKLTLKKINEASIK